MEMFDRQIRVFGEAGQKALQELTVAIVGAGGIGSLVTILLIRLGIGRIIIIDHDIVEESNLNRLAGSTQKDVKNKTAKVKMLAKYGAKINSKCHITAVQKSILDEDSHQYVKQADVVFGCTDTQSSRSIINELSVKYLIPYFDTGTGIQADEKLNIAHAGGQVRIVIPGMGCLNCINGIDLDIAQQEMLPEKDRQIAIQRGYIAGADVHSPAVASLNGTIANLAVTEFISFATGFKPLNRYIFYDFINALVVPFEFKKDPKCFTCTEVGSLAVGDNGIMLPAEMLLTQKQTENTGEIKMEHSNQIYDRITELADNAQKQGCKIEAFAAENRLLLKDVALGDPFNKQTCDIRIEFARADQNPVIFLPEDITTNNQPNICPKFLSNDSCYDGWKPLCPEIFQDVSCDELLEFILCLRGLLTAPQYCGLMGCQTRDSGETNIEETVT